MNPRYALWIAPLLLATLACSSLAPTRQSSSALEFLYPDGRAEAVPASDVTLRLPARVGLAFPPGDAASGYVDPLTEGERQALLNRVAAAFREAKGVGHLEVVPSLYLTAGGGFADLDRLKSSLGLDLMVLVSYDQTQFTESTRASWTYLTVVGPMLIQGEKNEVRTVMDAVVYDIPSRALLFRAAGESTVEGRSSPLNERRKRRQFSSEGFAAATDQMIGQLQQALAAFEEQSRAGTVRGQGTPQIALFNAEGERINPAGGAAGAGALGPAELVLAMWVGGAWAALRRPRRRP